MPDERDIAGLPGYPGASAKAGNWVNQQFQLDAFGEALLLFAAAARHDHLDSWHWKAAEAAVDGHQGPAGRPGRRRLGARRPAVDPLPADLRGRAARDRRRPGRPHGQACEWEALADAMLADAARDGLHHRGYWQRAQDDERTDAALLLPAIRGAHPGGGPPRPWPPSRRSRTTWPRTGTSTGSGTTSGRCTRPRARSCCAGS